jgi:N-acetylmuramoyl-L-alanine amidase
MRKSISSLVLLVVLLAVSLAITQKTSAQAPSGTVNTGALNIRSGPGVNYNVITFVYRNTVLTLLARNADASWVKVMTTTGVQGWVNARYVLTPYPLANLLIEGSSGGITAVVTSYALNVRSGPGPGYTRLIAVPTSTVFTLLARTHEATWVKVALATGTQGWVNASYISASHPIINLPVEGCTLVPPPTSGYRTHVAQWGETLFRIGLHYGVDMYDIARLNGITNLGLIYAGQVLLIP